MREGIQQWEPLWGRNNKGTHTVVEVKGETRQFVDSRDTIQQVAFDTQIQIPPRALPTELYNHLHGLNTPAVLYAVDTTAPS